MEDVEWLGVRALEDGVGFPLIPGSKRLFSAATPVGGGGVTKATITSTTGSPTIDSSTRAGKTIYSFTGSGSFTVGVAGYLEVLVVGGGGGSNTNASSGGGGAGGYVYESSKLVGAGTYTVTVGAGNSGNLTADGLPSSAIFSLTNGDSVVAITGGGTNGSGGNSGASGAGGWSQSGSQGRFGQGNNGGAAESGYSKGAGGGGAGGAGGAASGFSNGPGGPGGTGVANSITGTSTFYAGGGGGGAFDPSGGAAAGGSGGGGNGNSVQGDPGVAGTANTGGGAGGKYTGAIRSGGSGIVIVVVG
jgi:hypothetical protein